MNETIFQRKLKAYFNKQDRTDFDKIHQGIYGAGMADLIGSSYGTYIALECKVIDLPKRDSTKINLMRMLTPLQKQFLIRKKLTGSIALAAFYINDLKVVLFFDPSIEFIPTKKNIVDYVSYPNSRIDKFDHRILKHGSVLKL